MLPTFRVLFLFAVLALAATLSSAKHTTHEHRSHKGKYVDGCLRAKVDKSGVKASVTVCPRGGVASNVRVSVDLDDVDKRVLPANCSVSKLTWHVHQYWKSESASGVGSTECGAPITGDHVDPTLACGPKSGATACPVVRSATEKFAYTCTPEIFKKNPYACEVGDYSNKFGTIDMEDWGDKRSFHDVAGPILSKETMGSIVFHCANTGDRAFCAPFTTKP